jgi:hypothetical protein
MGWKYYYRSALLSLSLIVTAPGLAYAVSFGKLSVTSRLGEPFSANISMNLTKDEVEQGADVSLGLPADYMFLELERALPLSSLSINMIGRGEKRVLKIHSLKPFNEPFFNLLLKTSAGRGSYYSNFPVFLDISMGNMVFADPVDTKPTAEVLEVPVEAEAVVEAAPSLAVDDNKVYGPVRWEESLAGIALKLSGENSPFNKKQVAVALWHKNRKQFVRENMSGLQVGAMLQVPTNSEIALISAEEANVEFARQWRVWKLFNSEPALVEDSIVDDETPPLPYVQPLSIAGHKMRADVKRSAMPELADVSMDMSITPDGVDDSVIAARQLTTETILGVDRNYLQDEAVQENVQRMDGKVVELTEQVTQLTTVMDQLSTQLKQSENSRNMLQNRLAQLEAKLSKAKAAPAVVESGLAGGWLYGVVGSLVLVMVGFLLWFGRLRRESLPNSDAIDSAEVVAASETQPPPPEPTIETLEPAGVVEVEEVVEEDIEELVVEEAVEEELVEEDIEEEPLAVATFDEVEPEELTAFVPDQVEVEPDQVTEEKEVVEAPDEVIDFTPVDPETIVPHESVNRDDSSLEQVDFVPVATDAAVSEPMLAASNSVDVETIEFALDVKESPEAVVEEQPEIALDADRDDHDGSILEIDSVFHDEGEPVSPSQAATAADDEEELILEIGYDLEDLSDSEPQKK